MKIKKEALFCNFAIVTAEPNDKGREQFFERQTYGVEPENPDPYYIMLTEGQKWFDWQVQEYVKLYLCDEWWGWDTIIRDYLFSWDEESKKCVRDDRTWILPYLFSWKTDIKEIIAKQKRIEGFP